MGIARFWGQMMNSSVPRDQREHPVFLQLDQLCNEMESEPEAIQFTSCGFVGWIFVEQLL